MTSYRQVLLNKFPLPLGQRASARALTRLQGLDLPSSLSALIQKLNSGVTVPPQTTGPFLRVDGQWDIVQENGIRVQLTNVKQNNATFSAAATHGTIHSVSALGNVNGPNFQMTINWEGGARGSYTGTLTHGPFTPPPIGFLKGETMDLDHPGTSVAWSSEGKNFQIE